MPKPKITQHPHYWPDEEAAQVKDWLNQVQPKNQTSGAHQRQHHPTNSAETDRVENKGSKSVQDFKSEHVGELYGEKYVRQVLNYEPLLERDDKTVRQGIDGIYRDPKTQYVVGIEFKGKGAEESKLQQDQNHLLRQAEIALGGDKYHTNKVSTLELNAYSEVLKAHLAGNLRCETIRTTFDRQGHMVSSRVAVKYPDGQLSPNFVDSSNPEQRTAKSPEARWVQQEDMIAKARQTAEDPRTTPKTRGKVVTQLKEIQEAQSDPHRTTETKPKTIQEWQQQLEQRQQDYTQELQLGQSNLTADKPKTMKEWNQRLEQRQQDYQHQRDLTLHPQQQADLDAPKNQPRPHRDR